MFEKGQFQVSATKKYFPQTALVKDKINLQFPKMQSQPNSHYFVEIQDDLLTNTRYQHPDSELQQVNTQLREIDQKPQKIGVVYMGKQAPGGNNIIDGLLRYQAQRGNVELLGFINGVQGLMNNDFEVMTRETFKNYVNLGGYDYIGRGKDELRTEQQKEKTLEVVNNLGLTGLVIAGATHAMTDAVYLSEFFEANNCACRVITIPATVDGNIHHNYIQTSIGFDTASKVYSQLIGNMLTDSASAIKYWYFIRLMGKDPSHLAVECSLKTSPNYVIVSEECRDRNESL